MALGALTARPSSSLSLEDLFESRTRLDEKAARAHTWEQLPTRAGEHQHFTHSPEWAQQVFGDVIDRLRRLAPATRAREPAASSCAASIDSLDGALPDSAVSAQEHVVTSDVQWALEAGATAFPKTHLLADRREGRYLASVEQDGKWFAVSKVLLTACLAQGRDAVIAGVPDSLVDLLRLTCPEIARLSRIRDGRSQPSRGAGSHEFRWLKTGVRPHPGFHSAPAEGNERFRPISSNPRRPVAVLLRARVAGDSS